MKAFRVKRFLLGTVLAVALLLVAIAGAIGGAGATVHASGAQEINLIAEVSDVISGQANPEFTVMFKVENNSGKIGGAEFVITPLDDNISIGTAAQNYVKGDAWSDVNAAARIVGEKNIHILGTDDNGISKATFLHGGYKFVYQGTPSGPIEFNVALEAVCDEIGEENITVKFNNQTLTTDYSQANLTVTPREVETTNTLSGLTLSVGGTQILSGTGDSQTVSEPIAFTDKGNVKISATRAGAASKIKITEGDKVILAEQASDAADVSLGDLAVGEHTLTITVTSESGAAKTYTVKFTVAEALATPIPKPNPSATTESGFTGEAIDFTPDGMADLVSSGKVKLYAVSDSGAETEVGIDAFKPTNAGSYKIVARPVAGFCWDGAEGADAEYSFTVKKATLSAVAGEAGKLPTFTSDSYKGSLDGILEFKYYTDAACTQEVSKDSLTPGMKYYAKPVLKSGAESNFEFDSGDATQGFVNGGVEYEPPQSSGGDDPQGDNGEKKGIPFWVWIIVAAVALLLIILLIVLLVRRSKKEDKVVVQNAVPAAQPVQPVVNVQEAQGAQAAISAEKVEKIEDRMREMEHEAHEREITRYKEDAERAERKAEQKEAAAPAPVQPVAAAVVQADPAAQERVKELESRMREMEHEAHEREIARYKEEAERAERKAESGQNAQQSVPPQPTQPVQSDTDAKIEKLSEEMRRRDEELKKHLQSQAEAQKEAEHKREKERLAELKTEAENEAERLREELKYVEREKARAAQSSEQAKTAPIAPVVPPIKNAGTEDSEVDAETYAMLRAYEERLRSMEREMQERKMESLVREENERARKQLEDEARMRRHEEEMQRLRDLQEQERRRRETQSPYYGQQFAPQPQQNVYAASAMNNDYQRRQQELEMKRLQLLEEQLRQKEIENQLLNEQLRQQYPAYPPYGYGGYPPYGGAPQQPMNGVQSPMDPKKR